MKKDEKTKKETNKKPAKESWVKNWIIEHSTMTLEDLMTKYGKVSLEYLEKHFIKAHGAKCQKGYIQIHLSFSKNGCNIWTNTGD